MSSKIVTLPLEDPFNIPDDITIDIFNSKFSDDETSNIVTSFIYLRNIEYTGNLDFSNSTYEQKANLLRMYLLRDIKDLTLKQLDYTILRILLINENFDELNELSIFDRSEIDNFATENFDILYNLESFIQSIPYYCVSLDKSEVIPKELNNNIPETDEILDSYECALNLIKYKYTDLLMMIPDELKAFRSEPLFWKVYFYYDNYELADLTCSTIFSTIYSETVQDIGKDKGELLSSE